MSQTTAENVAFETFQTDRFKENLTEILTEKFKVKVTFSNMKLVQARINTNEKLSYAQLNALSYLKMSWHFEDMELSRSGAGLKIEYKPKTIN